MRLSTVIAAVAIAATGIVPARADKAPGLEPYQMVRSLQLVQDRVAIGDHAALPIQRKLLEMIDARLRTASAADLMQPRNLRSMMIYAMSGGNPDTLRTLAHRMHLEEHDGRIIAGVLSYLNGATQTAKLTLQSIEPMQEPIETAAFLALIKGSVNALDDPPVALKLLDDARLLAPGTLVEEAALRRSVALATTMRDVARFLRTSDQYVRIYLRSPYASQFADSFVSGVIALRETIDLAEVDAIVAMMSAEQRKVIYLRIARRAAIDGLTELSTYAAQRADEVGGQQEAERDPRVLLYTSLTNVATDPVDDVRERISRIDRKRLSAGDRKLLDAVLAVSGEIVRDPADEPPPEVVPALPSDPEAGLLPLVEQKDGGSASGEPQGPSDTGEAAAPMPAASDAQAAASPAEPGPPAGEPAQTQPQATKPAPEDPSEQTLSEGRRKLAEIDDLLAGAAK